MLTYQVRPRVLFPSSPGAVLRLPGRAELEFVLSPGEPFGGPDGPSRTAALGSDVRLLWNANVGRSSITSTNPLDPLRVAIGSENSGVRLDANVLTLTSYFRSAKDLVQMLNAIHFGLPLVLVTEYIDAPTITQTVVRVEGSEFVWQYARGPENFDVTTTETQEDRFKEAWSFLEFLLPSENRRLFAALSYFHTATRLEIVGVNSWEFMGEILLNFAKLLEVLFPAENGKSIDSARVGLTSLNFTSEEVAKWFIPALALRSNLDVAHVSLATLDPEELRVLNAYTEGAKDFFRQLMQRIIAGVKDRTYALPPYSPDHRNRQAERVIRRMKQHFPEEVGE